MRQTGPSPGSMSPKLGSHLVLGQSFLMRVSTLRISSVGVMPRPSSCTSSPSAYRGSLSVRVQVAHVCEWRPGSRLAALVAIWCCPFTQVFFFTCPCPDHHTASLLRPFPPVPGPRTILAGFPFFHVQVTVNCWLCSFNTEPLTFLVVAFTEFSIEPLSNKF